MAGDQDPLLSPNAEVRSQNAEITLFSAKDAKKIGFSLLLLHSYFCILHFVLLHLNQRDPLTFPLF
jgi:hypothetical protein